MANTARIWWRSVSSIKVTQSAAITTDEALIAMPALCSCSNSSFMYTILTRPKSYLEIRLLTVSKGEKNDALVTDVKSLPRAAVYEGVGMCYTEGLCVRQTKKGKHSLVPRELLFIQCHGATTQTAHVCLGQTVASPEAWLNACSCKVLKLCSILKSFF